MSESEHKMTSFFAQLLGGEPYYGEGTENWMDAGNPDYIIMPSGYAIPTEFCVYYVGHAADFAPGVRPMRYLFGLCASGEQWVIESDGQSYDPRTNTVHPISEGGTGQPSPRLAPFYVT